jgi:hypothetical protein
MASAQILTNGKALYAYNGTEWVPLNTAGNLVNSTRWQKVMTGGETSLSGNDDSGESLIYTPGYEQVYLNGVLLARDADYTATTGTTITGLTALTAGHIVEILAYNNINVANTYTQGQIDNKIANTFTRWIDTLSASATVLSGLDDNSTTLSYTPGLEQVYVNGILLLPSEYTATSGSSIVLSEAAVENDVIQIYTLKNFRVPNTYTIGQTDDQFLTKTSASAEYIPDSIVDAKGDLITATADNVPARLAVGTNNSILTADSSQDSGIKWVVPNNFELLNAGGTSLTGSTIITISGISNRSQIFVRIDPASAANVSSLLFIRLNSDTDSSYYGSWLLREATAMYNEQGAKNGIYVGRMGSNSTGNNFSGHCLISGTNSTGIKPFVATGFGDGTDSRGYNVTGFYSGASSITSVSINSSSGNFDGGTVYVYGTY